MTSTSEDPLPDLTRGLRSPNTEIRARAARALGRLGWLAKDALPLLVNALSDSDASVREAAAHSIGQMGPETLPYLVKMLTHEDKYVRRNAVWALGKLGPLAKSALADLCAALRDPDPRTASGAAQALGNMGADATDAIPSVAEAMRGTNIVLCRLASKALSQIGRPALTVLIAHVRHRDPFIRGEAALALGWMGEAASQAIPTLIEGLRCPDPGRRSNPVSVGSQTPSTNPEASTPGPNPDETSRAYMVTALARIGGHSPEVSTAIRSATRDPSDLVRQAAGKALQCLHSHLTQSKHG